jgi:hypothetical protein
MTLARTVEPEWLDLLPPDNPRARRSRGDLRRINALMLNQRAIVRDLRREFAGAPPRRMVEIGAGDGTFMLGIARRLAARWPGVHVVLLDRQDLVTANTRAQIGALGWSVTIATADVFVGLGDAAEPPADVIIANLFLHHFESEPLYRLLALIARRSRMLIVCEPRRSWLALAGSHLLALIGCNDVTRHDARASVRAGFGAGELSALWPGGPGASPREYAYGLFSHCFVAGANGGAGTSGAEGRR